MRFLKTVKHGSILLDKIDNGKNRKGLDIELITHKITDLRQRWKEHFLRMEESRFPKAITVLK